MAANPSGLQNISRPGVCKADRAPLTAERLRELLEYNPETGDFIWLVATGRRVHVGDVAGSTDSGGYRHIRIDGELYRAHRLVFLYMTFAFPDSDVDHRDGDRANNRWGNLRTATASQNAANSTRPATNTSGFKGVSWHKKDQKWEARIMVNSRKLHLGYFDTPEAGHQAYMAAAAKHFGEFASDGERAA
jgi:hypothetical protein